MAAPPPIRSAQASDGSLGALQRLLHEPTGLGGAGIAAALCVILSLALWIPLAWPSGAIRGAIPAADCRGATGAAATICAVRVAATPLLAPLLLAIVAFVFRRSLTAAVGAAKRRYPGTGSLLAAALATVVFVLSWAGSHAGRPMEFGILPQIVFPALTGLSTYAIGRWGPVLHRGLRIYFDTRDRLSMKVRMLVVMAVPTAASIWLATGAGPSRAAMNEQVVVVIGIVIGFLVVAPRPGEGGPR